MVDLKEAFGKYEDERPKFSDLENPLHARPDLCAFLLLDKLVPRPGRDMVSAADHDVTWLDTDCDALAAVATEDDIRVLAACGVFYDDEVASLSMYV